ncbi:MAG TPA: SH3 domain-containing protein, partial [Thiothrix sp.]|nr:SH3 domain-containing protein [Thiothrix sp.]
MQHFNHHLYSLFSNKSLPSPNGIAGFKPQRFLLTCFMLITFISSLAISQAYALGGRVFSVARIPPWDSLNVRQNPGINYKVVGQIPADGEGVVALGKQTTIGKTEWVQVSWGSLKGWVNRHYLMPVKGQADSRTNQNNNSDNKTVLRSSTDNPSSKNQPATNNSVFNQAQPKPKPSAKVLECGGTEPFWNIDLSQEEMRVNIRNEQRTLPLIKKTPQSQSSFNIASLKARQGKDEVELFLVKSKNCKDGITEINY